MPNLMERAEAARRNIANYVGRDPGFYAPNFDVPLFDPANEEVDDYFCLRMARKWREDQLMFFCIILETTWTDRLKNHHPNLCCDPSLVYGMYRTGDYMNAYLEVADGGK